jgi:polysaccharide pyruvyl transferase WcaK-like protein
MYKTGANNAMDKRQALLLNFTGSTYHWGCYGTSMELWQTLVDLGYYVDLVDVRDPHVWANPPQHAAHFTDADFGAEFLKANLSLYHALLGADVVVVNGEGTLHGLGRASINLLYVMYLAKVHFKKPVHLINGSFFPADDGQPNDALDALYGQVARVVDAVVPRETASKAVLARLGLATQQGFDCLPRFIHRYGLLDSHVFQPTVVVAGGVSLTQVQAQNLGRMLAVFQTLSVRLVFLTGAKASINQEDGRVYQEMLAQCPELNLVTAQTMREWLDAIRHSACMVSARYHHTLAAVSLGVPTLVFPSNTPKIDASMAMLGMDHVLNIEHDLAKVKDLIQHALQQKLAPVPPENVRSILNLCANNFVGLV